MVCRGCVVLRGRWIFSWPLGVADVRSSRFGGMVVVLGEGWFWRSGGWRGVDISQTSCYCLLTTVVVRVWLAEYEPLDVICFVL